jgi:hypothetical protein
MHKTVLALSLLCFLHPAVAQSPSAEHAPLSQPHQSHPDSGLPVTADSVVLGGTVIFQDTSKSAGLTTWHHTAGTLQKSFILEAKGPGVAVLDYDNDGWLDIYLVNGSTVDALTGRASPPHAALFRNNHDGTFTDVATKAGVTNDRWGYGAVVADFDNDGWPDIYVSNYGQNRLYRNNRDGTFTDVAEKAGVTIGTATNRIWSTGATFGDYDGDGRLDFFVAGYLRFNVDHPPATGSAAVNFTTCVYHKLPVMCGPKGLVGERDHLFHNNGDGTFTDVSEKLGVADHDGLYGLGALFTDVNNDGRPDLLVANDSTPNYLYINKGDGTFEDQSYPSGFALNGEGHEAANMGLAVGDYENNGHLDILSTTFADDYDILFRNDGHGLFTDVSAKAGIAAPTMPFVGFGDAFFDFDNDGWKDLIIANGHVYPQVDQHLEWGTTYAQRPLLFHNDQHGRFDLMPAVEGSGLATVSVGRGLAVGDFFNDGKIDVLIANMDQSPVLLRNVNPDHHYWIELKLVGGPKSPRDATGTTVYLSAGGIRQRGDVLSGGSYLSSNDPRLHFGLGDTTSITSIEVHWPDGAVESITPTKLDRILTITEGKGITASLCGGAPCLK